MELLKQVEERIVELNKELEGRERVLNIAENIDTSTENEVAEVVGEFMSEGTQTEDVEDDVYELEDTLTGLKSIQEDIKSGRELDSTQESFLRLEGFNI